MTVVPPTAQVSSQTLNLFFSPITAPDFQSFLAKYQLDQLKPGWYPLQNVLDMIDEIIHHSKSKRFDLMSWALRIGKLSTLDLDPMPLHDLFTEGIPHLYHLYHRGDGIGTIRGTYIEDQHITLTSSTPYPDNVEYGIFYGQAKTLLPLETPFTVEYHNELDRRAQGKERTIYHIIWE